MKIRLALATFLAALLLLPSCDNRNSPLPQDADPRGTIVSTQLVKEWTVDEVNDLIQSVDPFLLLFVQGKYEVRQYNIIYETVDVLGAPTIASGAVCIPVTDTAGKAFPIACYSHGTTLRKESVATRGGGQIELGVIFASEGYIGALPDFLGLGDGPGLHPYIHANSEATAVADMLRATRDIVATEDRSAWNDQLFLYGYSQGGHATMAAHRYIQTNLRDEFTVTASAPMSGPYDVSGVQEEVLVSFDPYPTPGYMPYILYSYNLAYNIVPDVTALLKPPYDSIVPPFMDGSRSIGDLNDVSNPVPRLMVLDSVMNAYENDPNHPLKLALRRNDLWDWVPQTPVRMYYCTADDQVSYQNALVAYDRFLQNGASPDIVSLEEPDPNANHNDCAQPCFLAAKVWFDSLRAL
ncbi:MAG: hypothetical protein AAGN35_26975 [Bacteroidota bacterium]